MDKRYQVFISSTRRDLEEERRTVADGLLRGQYIPVAMEQFTAAPEDAWTLIQRFIDECDYYVVILAGMYGSTRPDGISYTEAEYDYAVSRGMPILAFVHKDTGTLASARVESDPVARDRLDAFRKKIEQVRLRDEWNDRYELAYKVSSALDKLVRDHPATGWIRGDMVPDEVLQSIQSVAEPCARLGITRVSEDGVSGEAMKRHLAAASSIKIYSTSAFRLIDTYRGALTEALAHGCSIRVLLPKQGSQFISDAEELEAVHVARGLPIETELGVVKTRLVEALSVAATRTGPGSTLGQVEIGYFTTHLRLTMILCDDSWGWLTVTLPPFRATETMSMELEQTDYRPLLQTAIAHFDRSWAIVSGRGDIESLEPTVRQ